VQSGLEYWSVYREGRRSEKKKEEMEEEVQEEEEEEEGGGNEEQALIEMQTSSPKGTRPASRYCSTRRL
jgi:hypothetical protein